MTKNVIDLNNSEYAVIDLDSGTVLGTNVMLVRVPQDEAEWEEIISNDSVAFDYAQKNGIALTAEV